MEKDNKLKALLAQLLVYMKVYGPQSKTVKKYIKKNKSYPEFAEMAETFIFIAKVNAAQRMGEWEDNIFGGRKMRVLYYGLIGLILILIMVIMGVYV